MHQFNDKNVCPNCVHPGEWKHGSHYYLPQTKYVSRSNDSVKMAENEAEKNRVIVDGIKGRSILTVVIDLVGVALLNTCIVYWTGIEMAYCKMV